MITGRGLVTLESDLLDSFHLLRTRLIVSFRYPTHDPITKDPKTFTIPFRVSDIRCLEPYGLEMSRITGQKTTFVR